MDGMNYLGSKHRELTDDVEPVRGVGRAMALTFILAIVVLSAVVGLRSVGVPPLISDEVASAPIGS